MVQAAKLTRHVATFGCMALAAACGETPTSSAALEVGLCTIPESEIFNGGPGKDGIPALSNPPLVSAGDPDAAYLRPDERIIGLLGAEGPVAVPHQILWWHEIVNFTVDGRRIAATHCPLTGSSLVFDREEHGGVEFGVSGLLYQNNLMMYDRSSQESLWPQMSRGARCGPKAGTPLTMVPSIEMTWEAWVALHPDTRVLSNRTGVSRSYEVYPYGNYDALDNDNLLFPLEVDTRRPAKERVLGVPEGDGVAYPFGELALAGPVAVIEHGPGLTSTGVQVVFWDEASGAAALYDNSVDGQGLTFEVQEDVIVDLETGSEWRIDGLATAGPLAGRRLAPIAEAYVSFWFAWAAFHPQTLVWDATLGGFPEGAGPPG